jgi:hypothetical protein
MISEAVEFSVIFVHHISTSLSLDLLNKPQGMAAGRYPHLAWRNTSLGHWERELDEAECFYTCLAKAYEGSGRMFFAITGFVSLTVELKDTSPEQTGRRIEEAFRQAWLRLRYDHPTLSSQTFYDHHQHKWKKRYTPFHPKDVETQTADWLKNTLVPISPGIFGLEWCNADPPAPKLPTLFLITPPNPSETDAKTIRRDVVIRTPHDTMDGVGTYLLLSNLLAHAAQSYEEPLSWFLHEPGSEIQNLSPPLRVAASISPILTHEQQERLQNIITANEALRKDTEHLAIPFKKGQVLPGKHQRIVIASPASDTKRLLESCKRLATTVTHVYHAAIAITIRDMQSPGPHKKTARYINYSFINERQHCIGEYATPKHAAAVYQSISGKYLALDLTIPSITQKQDQYDGQRQKELLDLAGQVRDYYHRIRDSPDSLDLTPGFWSMVTPHISDPTNTDLPVPAPNLSPSVSFSSMGAIDRIIAPQYGTFKVSDPWVTGEELGTGLGVFLGTWEGSLKLSAAYNDTWHDRKEVQGFLRHCQEVVSKGLGLDKDAQSKI